MGGLKVFGGRAGDSGGVESPVTGGKICYDAADGSGKVCQLGGPSFTEGSQIQLRVEFVKRLLSSITK